MGLIKIRTTVLFRFLLCFFSISKLHAQIPEGNWHASISLNDTTELPFVFNISQGKITIRNGEEEIIVHDIKYKPDSVIIQMPVFDSEFRCKIFKNYLEGVFINHARVQNNIFNFRADHGLSYRFSDKPERAISDITGK